ncbi:hypothetical protein EYF80_058251 [Liparis tanakae]|uniref:Uncharacterized protein n=1 Tax=Liparis tanakae TaxID=230148 RepID=A0A4Z2ES13_9TELE|nr:hypothetical protein EYF80_058251 [Liparis tanakae]
MITDKVLNGLFFRELVTMSEENCRKLEKIVFRVNNGDVMKHRGIMGVEVFITIAVNFSRLGLAFGVDGGVEEGHVEPLGVVRRVAAVTPDRRRHFDAAGRAVDVVRRPPPGARGGRPLAAGGPGDRQSELLQGRAFGAEGLAVPPAQQPGVGEADVDAVGKQHHVPPLGLHGGAVEAEQRFALVDARHVGVVPPDHSRTAHGRPRLALSVAPDDRGHRLHPHVRRQQSDRPVVLPPDGQYPIVAGDVVARATRDGLLLQLLDGLERRASDPTVPGRPRVPAVLVSEVAHQLQAAKKVVGKDGRGGGVGHGTGEDGDDLAAGAQGPLFGRQADVVALQGGLALVEHQVVDEAILRGPGEQLKTQLVRLVLGTPLQVAGPLPCVGNHHLIHRLFGRLWHKQEGGGEGAEQRPDFEEEVAGAGDLGVVAEVHDPFQQLEPLGGHQVGDLRDPGLHGPVVVDG